MLDRCLLVRTDVKAVRLATRSSYSFSVRRSHLVCTASPPLGFLPHDTRSSFRPSAYSFSCGLLRLCSPVKFTLQPRNRRFVDPSYSAHKT